MNEPPVKTDACALHLTQDFNIPPEELFDYFTRAERLTQWFAPDASLRTEVRTLELKVGGRYELAMINDAEHKTHVVVGEYREIERPTRLVYSWHWQSEPSEEVSLVTLEFEPIETGTRLHLRHDRFETEDSRAAHGQGWEGCLNRLVGCVLARTSNPAST